MQFGCSAKSFQIIKTKKLTFVNETDSIIDEEAQDGHEKSEQGQKYPVLSQFSEAVPPNETDAI